MFSFEAALAIQFLLDPAARRPLVAIRSPAP